MEHGVGNSATREHDQSSATTEQSSNESSLNEVSDVPRTEVQGLLNDQHNDKDRVHAEVLYDIPTSSPELDVVAVSVSPPPTNALHLHLQSSGEVHVVEPTTVPDNYHDSSAPLSASADAAHTSRPSYRVRFRSRVRIASGMHPHSHSHTHSPSRRNSAGSVDSESSLCSSISAPLRYTPDESDSRISYTFPTALKNKKRRFRRPLTATLAPGPPPLNARTKADHGERAPLLRAPGSRLGARTRRLYGEPNPGDEDEELIRRRGRPPPARQDVNAFGPWPWRLFNGYWWAWKCGSIACWCCPADGDEDESEDEHGG